MLGVGLVLLVLVIGLVGLTFMAWLADKWLEKKMSAGQSGR